MTNHTYKIVEIVSSSPNGTDEAIRNALAEASRTLRQLDRFEMVETRIIGSMARSDTSRCV